MLAVPPVNMNQVIGMLRLNGIAKSAVRIVPYQFDPDTAGIKRVK